jgi:hypothetical protein
MRISSLATPRASSTLCWCRCQVVKVPATDVRAGRTFSCGRKLCDALGFTALVASGDPCDCKERVNPDD